MIGRRSRLFVAWGILSLTTGLPVLGIVGVNDPCPWPTPYPPPGAGWAVVNNDDFEGGFTGGAANQWTAWQDDTYSHCDV